MGCSCACTLLVLQSAGLQYRLCLLLLWALETGCSAECKCTVHDGVYFRLQPTVWCWHQVEGTDTLHSSMDRLDAAPEGMRVELKFKDLMRFRWSQLMAEGMSCDHKSRLRFLNFNSNMRWATNKQQRANQARTNPSIYPLR